MKDELYRNCAAAILAGGKSLRMGEDKAGLTWEGKTFLERIAGELGNFPARFVSLGAEQDSSEGQVRQTQEGQMPEEQVPEGWTVIRDRYEDAGPMAGIGAVLEASPFPWVFVVSCDMPRINSAVAEYLWEHASESTDLAEFTAIEVQTIDTTGNYRDAREALLDGRRIEPSTVGLNWENVSKRIIPQLIYKGQVLQREDLCRTGLYFVCPQPVYERVLTRLGGREKLPKFPTQPASIHFVSYDYLNSEPVEDGSIAPLGVLEEHCTTVYKVQEAFSSLNLTEGNVYRDALRRSLYGSVDYQFETPSYQMVAEPMTEYGKKE